jgi:hypothetical protein
VASDRFDRVALPLDNPPAGIVAQLREIFITVVLECAALTKPMVGCLDYQ